MTIPQIIFNNVSFQLDHCPVQLNKINLTFNLRKYGLVGDNGVGKTTLLKLISGEIPPNEGAIHHHAKLTLLPQSHTLFPKSYSILQVLCLSTIFEALKNVNSGNYTEGDLKMLQDHWDIETKIESIFRQLDLWPLDLLQRFSILSGGQKTKVLLAKVFLAQSDFILLDEPTNNLDKLTRDTLYQFIDLSQKGMIIVSHDRTLLNKMDVIVEMTKKGLHCYGGNYDFYHAKKTLNMQAIEQDHIEAKRSIKKTKASIQASRDKHEQRQSKGKKARKSRGQTKIILDAMKERSEKTQHKLSTKDQRLIKSAESNLATIKDKIEFKQDYNLTLDATHVPQNKTLLTIENLYFNYNNQNDTLIKKFNLTITGPERIAIVGRNGCGKSTLIKLIKGELSPSSGNIIMRLNTSAYLDQDVDFLEKELTLVENFQQLNPSLQLYDAYSALAMFHFRNIEANKIVSHLSGGEKMRAGLAICLLAKEPPQLIILDEPTNHLDITTVKAIEAMLNCYQGAILAISHDQQFLKNIGINKTISLDNT